MKRMCRKSVFFWAITWFLFALLWGCASTPTGEGKPDKTVSPQEMPGKTPTGKGMPADGSSAEGSQAPPVTQETNVTYYIHTVKWSGESLSIIASWYTGDLQNWKILREANPDMDPNVVVVGQKIRIPEHTMKTRSPMTKAHVDSYYHKAEKQKKPSSSSEKKSEKKDETPILYGPKWYPQK